MGSTEERLRLNRIKAIEHLGGKCVACGTTVKQLTFDHIDPETKPRLLNGNKDQYHVRKVLRRSWPNVLLDLHIFQLLCGPCHKRKTKRENLAIGMALNPRKYVKSWPDVKLYDYWLFERRHLR